ncbi:ABC transporter permease subunit, partial [Saccharomonospora sp. NPDC046836]|uniref:ABC transporter permease n=1 Tax=Saccharomonospora sp. NPDC046836 TaxID=3156921 RepID=UPI0033F12698
MTLRRRVLDVVLAGLVVALLWEVVGRLGLIAGGAFPALSAIGQSLAADWADYPPHLLATLRVAGIGFVAGNTVAVLLAVLFALVPVLERVSRTLLVTLFCLPIVVVAPILGVAYDGDQPKIILAALSVFFPTTVSTLVGLRSAPEGALAVVRSAGGGRVRQLWLVRLRAGLPGLLAGFQVAAPGALLGAILGEFLGGSTGLGVYLLGSMGRGEPAKLWAIGLVATTVCAIGYGLFAALRRSLRGTGEQLAVVSPDMLGRAGGGRAGRVAVLLAGLGVVLLAWYAFLWSTGLPRPVVNSPVDLVEGLTSSPAAATARERLLTGLGESLPVALLGVVAGLLVALLLAVALSQFPAVASTVLPFAFVSQTMPLVALTPLLALIFGRGTLTTVVVTISVTFFPSFVTITQGIAATPKGALDVLRSVDAGRWTVLRMVTLPHAMPHLFASARLAVPRALLGVVLAEQLITGTGLGGVLGESRGYLDYQMMWTIAAVV